MKVKLKRKNNKDKYYNTYNGKKPIVNKFTNNTDINQETNNMIYHQTNKKN